MQTLNLAAVLLTLICVPVMAQDDQTVIMKGVVAREEGDAYTSAQCQGSGAFRLNLRVTF